MAEMKSDTSKTKQLMETTEMKILQRIPRKSLMDREMSENITKAYNIEEVNSWVTKREQEWYEKISRIKENRTI